MLRLVLLACGLLAWSKAELTFGGTNSMLDPNRITWWRSKWAPAPITLSRNNRSQVVTATFYLSPMTAITNGVLEVTFPSGFTLPTSSDLVTVTGQVLQLSGVTYFSGQEYATSISGIVTPITAGPYGPFSLRTRYNKLGQQVDVNLHFGSVYIYGDARNLNSVTVTVPGAPALGTVVNRSDNSLSFKFLISVNLWKYDTFIITTDSRWTIEVGASCYSSNYVGRWNNFNGTNSANPHSLQCVVTPQTTPATSQSIYIYGLAVDEIDTTISDNQYVNMVVTAVTSPSSVFYGSTYSWTVSTCRFGTTTYLESGSYASGPLVTTDVITSAIWTPTWGASASSLLSSQTAFFDLTFAVTNPIPLGASKGCISINFSENIETVDSNWVPGGVNCYLVSNLGNGADCTISGNDLLISGLPAIEAGTLIKVRNIVTITAAPGSTAQINSINTFQIGDSNIWLPIDVGTNLGAFKVATSTSYTAVSSLNVGYHAPGMGNVLNWAAGGHYNAGELQNYNLQFAINGANGSILRSDSEFKISCPLSSSIEDFSLAIPSPDNWKFSSNISLGIQVDVSTAAATIPTVSYEPDGTILGSITFAGTILSPSPTFSNNLHLLVQTISGNPYITLPRIANNYATAYECRVAITTPSQPTQTAFVRLPIAPQPWQTSTISSICKDRVEGMPLIITIKPSIWLSPSNVVQAYYVEVSFTRENAALGLGSGLSYTAVTTGGTSRNHNPMSYAVEYPYEKPGSVPTNAKMYVTSDSTTLSFEGFGVIPSTTSVSFYVPIGGLGSNASLQGTISSVFFLTSDPRYRFITHSSVTAAQTLDTPATWTELTTDSVEINDSLTFTAYKTDAPSGIAWSYLILPRGFYFPSSGTIRNLAYNNLAGVTFHQAYWFTSTSSTFNFPGVLFSNLVSAGTPNIYADIPNTSTGGTFFLTGFSLALGSNDNLPVQFASGTAANSACVGNGQISFSVPVGSITNLAINPSNIPVRGVYGTNAAHTVTFTLQHEIPAGGTISMTFSPEWENPHTACTGCYASGLTATAEGGPVICTLVGNSVTVSNFSAVNRLSTVLNIYVFGLLSPASYGPFNFVTALSTSIGNAIIDSVSSFTGSSVTMSPYYYYGGSISCNILKTYPFSTGATSADLYISFYSSINLPVCTTITIMSPAQLRQSGDVKNACFLSPTQYSSCNVSGNSITLTLAQTYIAGSPFELYMDSMVDNSSLSGFTVAVSWGGFISQNSGCSYYSFESPSNSLAPVSSLLFSPMTAGEVATYVFEFKDTAAFAITDKYWIIFPNQYDYFLGDVSTWFSTEPKVYYIDCSSTQLGNSLCQVDHNVVIVSGSNAVPSSTIITVTINGVINPASGQTSSFQMYHVDASGTLVAVNQNIGTVTVKPRAANNIEVRSLVMSDNRLFRTSDYTWRLYLSDTMFTNSQLQVLFPPEYNLYLFDKKDIYTCSSTWLDISPSAAIKTQQSWNSASSCSTTRNLISLSAPATSITFTKSNIVTFNVKSVKNPQYGLTRSALSIVQDFEVTDSLLWPLWTYWVSKFTFFVYRTSSNSLTYTSRSYPNTNAADAGFFEGHRSLLVNGYNPQFKTNRIIVYPGVQTSDLFITTSSPVRPMAAKKVVLSPTTSSRTPDGGRLKYTSARDNWTLSQGFYSIQFRVCAEVSAIKGLYYIDWAINETKQTGSNEAEYTVPASTLVEVMEKIPGKYALSIANIPYIPVGRTSIPIRASISNAPCTDVSFVITVSGNPTTISIYPPQISFSPDVTVQYFQIHVSSDFPTNYYGYYGQSLIFWIAGEDFTSYSTTPNVPFTITGPVSPDNNNPAFVTNWNFKNPTKTSVSVSPVTNQVGVIYYQLAAKGTSHPSFSTLKSSVTALVYNGTYLEDGKDDGANSQSDPAIGESWEEFQFRLYKNHLQTKWTGAIAMYHLFIAESYTFSWLWGGTEYQIFAYLDNLVSTIDPPAHTEWFRTQDVEDSQPVSLKFTGLVSQSFSSRIAVLYAGAIGVNPERIALPSYSTSSTDTIISHTTFSYTLLTNRFVEFPSPADQAKVSGRAFSSLSTSLKNEGVANALIYVTNDVIQHRKPPTWITAPSIIGTSANSVTINMRSSTNGKTCCIAQNSSEIPTAEQVMLGLNAFNAVAAGACINTDVMSLNTVKITSLKTSTSYYVFCTATDTSRFWPTYMAYSLGSPLTSKLITTNGSCPVPHSILSPEGICICGSGFVFQSPAASACVPCYSGCSYCVGSSQAACMDSKDLMIFATNLASYNMPFLDETNSLICYGNFVPEQMCDLYIDVVGTIISNETGLHPTSEQCYKMLKANWLSIAYWFNYFFPNFTPPDTATETEVYELKTVLWLWIQLYGASAIIYDAKWQELVAVFNNSSLNWEQLLGWTGAFPGYLVDGTFHDFPAGLIPSNSELKLFNNFSTVCATSGCVRMTQCQQAAPLSPCASP